MTTRIRIIHLSPTCAVCIIARASFDLYITLERMP